MGAVIGKQDGHEESRSVVGVLAAGALAGVLAGLLTGAVALGVAELAAAIIGPNSAPVIAVGETAINLTPIPVKDFAITHFGSHDKQALVAGILVMLAGFAALIGVLAVRRIGYGLAGLAVFAGLGVTAALRLPGAGLPDVVPTLAGVTVAAGILVTLVRFVRPAEPRGGPALFTDGVIAGRRTPGGPAGGGSWRGRRGRRRWPRRPAGWATCCCGGSASPRPGRRSGCPRRRCPRRPSGRAPICGSRA